MCGISNALDGTEDDLVSDDVPDVDTGIYFTFNGKMYKQPDGVAMGSPLEPVLANLFTGYCEDKISKEYFSATFL